MRIQLGVPDNTFVDPQTYNELLTMHGTTMVFLFVVPMMAGFANYIVPLHDRRARHGVPATQRAVVLAAHAWAPIVFYGSLLFSPAGGRLDELRPALGHRLLAERRHRRLDLPDPPHRHQLDPRRDQLLRDDRQHARARHGLVAPAALLLDDPDPVGPAHPRLPDDRRRGHDAADRPPLRDQLLRPDRGRLAAALAAPLLVLRPPRGLHHDPARLRDHLRDPPGVRPQADLRLQGDRGLHGRHRVPRRCSCGPTTCSPRPPPR